MGKKALLIGCNYPSTKTESGCIKNVNWMRRCLIQRYGFADEDVAVIIDTDDSYTQPTGDYLFLHYSGHGTCIPAETREEDDTSYD